MCAHISRLGAVGIGVEASAGTAVTPTHWVQVSGAPSVNDKYEYQNIETARGRVEKSQNQKLMKAYGEGSIEMILDETVSVIPLGMILGSVASASAGGSNYTHTITVNNSNTAKTATIVLDRVQDTRTFTNAVVTGLDLKVSDGFAEMKVAFKSKASGTGAASESYTTVTNFSFSEMTAKFGADVSAATSASATPLSGVDLSIKRDAEVVFETGSTTPTKIAYKTLETSGNYSLLFESSTDRDKYLANTANAMILTFTSGASVITITLPKVMLSNWSPSNSLDDIVSQTADFSAHYDSTTTYSISATVTNTTASYTNLTA